MFLKWIEKKTNVCGKKLIKNNNKIPDLRIFLLICEKFKGTGIYSVPLAEGYLPQF